MSGHEGYAPQPAPEYDWTTAEGRRAADERAMRRLEEIERHRQQIAEEEREVQAEIEKRRQAEAIHDQGPKTFVCYSYAMPDGTGGVSRIFLLNTPVIRFQHEVEKVEELLVERHGEGAVVQIINWISLEG